MNVELVDDMIMFFELIGGCNAEANRQFPLNEIMDNEYKLDMEKLTEKYVGDFEFNELEDYLNVEELIYDKFKRILIDATYEQDYNMK